MFINILSTFQMWMVNMHSFTVSIPRQGNAAISIQKNLFQTQEEEVGLRMLPSAFLPELQVGHKTYKGMCSSNTVDHHHL